MMSLAPHWLWLIAGALLAIAELIAPGFFLIWVGLAAILTGMAALLLPVPVTAQFVIFAVAAGALVFAARRWFARNTIVSSDPLLNDRVARLIGEIVTAIEPVDGGGGRVKVGDGVWPARGGPAQIGERLRVVGCEKNVLLVEAV